jgi:hypothetical protein
MLGTQAGRHAAGLASERSPVQHRAALLASTRTCRLGDLSVKTQLGESFENREPAQAFVVAELVDLLAAHTGPNRRRPWREDPDRGCAAEGAAPGGTIPVFHEQTLSLTAGDYINRIYLRDQVLGPFPGAVVGYELVAMLAGRYELSSYLRDVGGATLWNGPRRTPLTITRG